MSAPPHARSRSQSSFHRSLASSALLEPEAVDFARIERPLNAHAKACRLLRAVASDAGAGRPREALAANEQFAAAVRDLGLPPERAAFFATVGHLNAFAAHLQLGQLAECEAALEESQKSVAGGQNLAQEEFRVLYVQILCCYLALRFRQGDLEGLREAKDVIVEFLHSQQAPQAGLNVFLWAFGLTLGPDTLGDAREGGSRGQRLGRLFLGLHCEFGDDVAGAKGHYYDFVQFARDERLRELLLVALKRLMDLEGPNEQAVARLQEFFRASLEPMVQEDPSFPAKFQAFEELFEVLAEVACLFQLEEARRRDLLPALAKEENKALVRAVLKAMARKVLLRLRRRVPTPQETRTSADPPGQRITFGDASREPPGRTAAAGTSPDPARQTVDDNELRRLQNQQPPWVFFEDLRSLVGSQARPKQPAQSAESDDPASVLRSLCQAVSEENSSAVLNTVATHPAFKSGLLELERSVGLIVHSCSSVLVLPAFRAIKAVARFRPPKQGAKTVQISDPRGQESQGPALGGRPLNSGLGRGLANSRVSLASQANSRRAVSAWSTTFLTSPEPVTKLNYSSSGKMTKFFQLLDRVNLRWADKAEHLPNPKLCHTVALASIRGITYGRVTKTFFKSANRKYEPWLCFSIILAKKSVDLYAPEDRVNFWVITLSDHVKAANPAAYCLRPGQFFWRKLKFLLEYCVVSQIPENQLKKFRRGISFCRLVLLYKIFQARAQKQAVSDPPSKVRR